VDAVTSNVVLLETLNGAMVQENSSGSWYSETAPNDSWAQIANPTPPPPPAKVVSGTGSDTLVLSISEDAWANGDSSSDSNGDAAFTVSVDGNQLAGTFFATASHAAGASQNFVFNGEWSPGSHSVAVRFLNDAWGGTAATDRNLYVNDVTYDGTDTGQSATLLSNGSHSFAVTDSTLPVTGSGADTLVLKMSEDYYKGDAQFTVAIDGKQLGGTFTAKTLHSSGASQNFTFKGDFGSGAHTLTVKFINDAYAGTPSTDRNLYVNDIVFNGTDTGKSAALLANGPKTFSLSGGTAPSVSEQSDHGSLAKNLAQTGTYNVGGDTFVLATGNAATVTLGTGSSQINFVAPAKVSLTGGSGQASVTCDGGKNSFVAGVGSLDVTGGAGADAYVFHATSGSLTLEDFSLAKGDTLTIDKSLQGSFHEACDGKGGMMLSFGGNTSQYVDLRGVAVFSSSSIHWV
jgi:Ca-dependent carbohydrate-binding module xylan-binding